MCRYPVPLRGSFRPVLFLESRSFPISHHLWARVGHREFFGRAVVFGLFLCNAGAGDYLQSLFAPMPKGGGASTPTHELCRRAPMRAIQDLLWLQFANPTMVCGGGLLAHRALPLGGAPCGVVSRARQAAQGNNAPAKEHIWSNYKIELGDYGPIGDLGLVKLGQGVGILDGGCSVLEGVVTSSTSRRCGGAFAPASGVGSEPEQLRPCGRGGGCPAGPAACSRFYFTSRHGCASFSQGCTGSCPAKSPSRS